MDMFHQDEEVLGGFCSLEEEVCVSEEQTYYDLVRALMTEGRLYLRQLNLTIKIFREPFCCNPTLYSPQVTLAITTCLYSSRHARHGRFANDSVRTNESRR